MNELGVVADGAALISDGVLREVGPSRRVENLAAARDAVEIQREDRGRVVMPGFIDSHTHLAFPPPDVAGEHHEAAAEAGAYIDEPGMATAGCVDLRRDAAAGFPPAATYFAKLRR